MQFHFTTGTATVTTTGTPAASATAGRVLLHAAMADPLEEPKHLCCPVDLALFRDPVVASDGHTSALQAWESRKSPAALQP